MTQIWCVYQQSAIATIWNFHTEQQQTSLYLIRSSRKITWTIKNPPRVMAPQNHVVSMLQNLRSMDQQSVTRESAPRTINYNLIYNFKYQFATIRKLSVHNSPHDFFGHRFAHEVAEHIGSADRPGDTRTRVSSNSYSAQWNLSSTVFVARNKSFTYRSEPVGACRCPKGNR